MMQGSTEDRGRDRGRDGEQVMASALCRVWDCWGGGGRLE